VNNHYCLVSVKNNKFSSPCPLFTIKSRPIKHIVGGEKHEVAKLADGYSWVCCGNPRSRMDESSADK
jgi:hypothetical protein